MILNDVFLICDTLYIFLGNIVCPGDPQRKYTLMKKIGSG